MTNIYDEVKSIEYGENFAHVMPDTSLKDFEDQCHKMAMLQRAVLWWIGDLALAVEKQHPRHHEQAWPVWMSPDQLARCKAVAAAYKPDERNQHATWATHMHLAKRPDRVLAVQATVDAGQNSDDVRKNPPPPQVAPEPEVEQAPEEPETVQEPPKSTAWLLAVDINYYAHRQFAKSGVDTAAHVVDWMERVIDRLHTSKNLTDVVFCFDSTTNHRRALTEGWEQPYKERTHKDPELVRQLQLLPELLKRKGRLCVSIEGMEADDVMASYAAQFDGKVTLMTADKDLRQCLSSKTNILRDIEWDENSESGNLMPVYKWIVGRWPEGREKPEGVTCHMTDTLNYGGAAITGISPELWPHFQAIAGDPGDDIKGVAGVGGKIAMDLVIAHGTVQNIIAACKDNIANLTKMKRMAVLDFEPFAETTLKLTTMRTDLDIPKTTRIVEKSDG